MTKERCGVVPGEYYRLVNMERKIDGKRLAMTVDQSLNAVAGKIEDGEDNTTDVNMVWSFTSGANDKVCMHTANGIYLKSFVKDVTGITGAAGSEGCGTFSLGLSEDGAWSLRNAGNKLLHASGNGTIIAYDDVYSLWYMEPVGQIDVPLHNSVNDNASFSSVYLPFDVTSVEGASLYTGEVSDEVITLHEQVTAKACTPVILKGELDAGVAKVSIARPSEEPVNVNGGLSGTLFFMTVEPNSVLTLGIGAKSGQAGFYSFTGTVIGPNRVYIDTTTGNAHALGLVFDNGGTTSIENIPENLSTGSSPVYDLTGRRVHQTEKGKLYIRNGVKYIAQ